MGSVHDRRAGDGGIPNPSPDALAVFRASTPGWLALPWELARDAGDASAIALGGVEVVRSLPAGMDPAFQLLGERLRVLMVISRPRGAGDVGYRMIARPLLDRLEAVPGPVEMVVLRPPRCRRWWTPSPRRGRRGSRFRWCISTATVPSPDFGRRTAVPRWPTPGGSGVTHYRPGKILIPSTLLSIVDLVVSESQTRTSPA